MAKYFDNHGIAELCFLFSCLSIKDDNEIVDDDMMSSYAVPTIRPPPPMSLSVGMNQYLACVACGLHTLEGDPSPLRCSNCFYRMHIYCHNINGKQAMAARNYDWQCPQCKTCVCCKASCERDQNILNCIHCDRACHLPCAGRAWHEREPWLCDGCLLESAQPKVPSRDIGGGQAEKELKADVFLVIKVGDRAYKRKVDLVDDEDEESVKASKLVRYLGADWEQTSVPDDSAAINNTATANKGPEEGQSCSLCQWALDEKYHGKHLYCGGCEKWMHESCAGYEAKVAEVIRTYDWRCFNCKLCSVCDHHFGDSKFVYCERCDRGDHRDCINLKTKTTKSWLCRVCKPGPLPKPPKPSKRATISVGRKGVSKQKEAGGNVGGGRLRKICSESRAQKRRQKKKEEYLS